MGQHCPNLACTIGLTGIGIAPTAASGSLEEQWRQECLAFARVRKLSHVEDMRILYMVGCTIGGMLWNVR